MLSFYHRLNEIGNIVPQTEKSKIKNKNRVHKNVANLFNTLPAIYFNYCNILQVTKKKRWIKYMIPVIYLLKTINMMTGTKRMKKKVNHSRNKLLLKE